MFLFRPSKNNQRYAIVPLLDKMDNDDEDFTDDKTGKGGGRDSPGKYLRKKITYSFSGRERFSRGTNQSFDLFSSCDDRSRLFSLL